MPEALWFKACRDSGEFPDVFLARENLAKTGENIQKTRVGAQPAPKYHTKGCSRSFADSPGARTLVFAAFEPFHSCEFRGSIARTPFCAILWRSPRSAERGAVLIRGLFSKISFGGLRGLHGFSNPGIHSIQKGVVFKSSSRDSRVFCGSRGFQCETTQPPS